MTRVSFSFATPSRRGFRSLLIAIAMVASLLPFAVATASPALANGSDLVISGVIDGPLSGGVPKAIEVYALNDIADLSIYGLGSANNGGGSDGEEFTFPADSATAGQFIYLAFEAAGFTSFFGFAPDYTSGAASINGDDAIELFMSGSVVDVFGDIDTDGTGQPWEHLDGWAYRANGSGPDGSTFVLANWSFSGPNALDGETTNGTAATPFPIGDYSPEAFPTLPGTGVATPNLLESGDTTLLTVDVTPGANPVSTGLAVMADLSAIGGSAVQPFFDDGTNGDATAGDNVFSYETTATGTVALYFLTAEFNDDQEREGSTSIALRIAPPVVKIHEVQGSGPDVVAGVTVRVQGVVTSLFEDNDAVESFFIQEEDADADADAATSEGILVFCGSCPITPAVGDLVTVVGTTDEFFNMSEIVAFGALSIVIDSSDNSLPAPTAVVLPATLGGTNEELTFEAVEGMIVEFTDKLVVSEYFQLGRFGQVVLTVDDRPFQFTHLYKPDDIGYTAFLDGLAASQIILDDNNNDGNDAIFGPEFNEPYPYTTGFSTANYFRGGDSITGLTGVMHWSWAGFGSSDAWRIRPVEGENYEFTPENERTATPADVGGRLTVAAFNVLNYFNTIDLTSSGSSGPCGPDADQDCRGADSDAERIRQLDKIAAALSVIDADVAGLIELENDGDDQSIDDIVGALNAIAGAGTYDRIETGFIGSDVIKVGLIYQPAAVAPVGGFAILDQSVDPAFLDSKNRPVLIQTFEEVATGERFTVAVNHLKSKGSPCDDVGDPNLNDGAGNCNATRAAAAQALADYLATDPTNSGDPDYLIVGDLNSYAMEDPIVALEAAGYTDLLESFFGTDVYTYVFDSQLGYLDYALANHTLLTQVTGATAWNINADEVNLLDYNDEFRTTGEASFERESNALDIYDPDPYRASDHDPVIVGLELSSPMSKKHAAVELLMGIDGETKKDDRLLARAIRDLNRSLNDKLWTSEATLDPEEGDLVFTRERQAVSLILQLSDAVQDDAMVAIPYLVAADRQLAVIAIGIAGDTGGDLTAAERFLGLGDDKWAAGDYEMAITRYKQAWEEAVAATLP